jgi:hypothetical protein
MASPYSSTIGDMLIPSIREGEGMYNRQSPYHRRIAHRLAKAKERNAREHNNRFVEIDHFMLSYETAYSLYYRRRCEVRYAHGWYYVHGLRYRHSTLQHMTAILLARLQEIEAPNPEKE